MTKGSFFIKKADGVIRFFACISILGVEMHVCKDEQALACALRIAEGVSVQSGGKSVLSMWQRTARTGLQKGGSATFGSTKGQVRLRCFPFVSSYVSLGW